MLYRLIVRGRDNKFLTAKDFGKEVIALEYLGLLKLNADITAKLYKQDTEFIKREFEGPVNPYYYCFAKRKGEGQIIFENEEPIMSEHFYVVPKKHYAKEEFTPPVHYPLGFDLPWDYRDEYL